MNLRNTLNGFTIIETMVALLLTALVLSFVYGALHQVQHHRERLSEQFIQQNEFNRFYRAWQLDVEKAEMIRKEEDSLIFSSQMGPISYRMLDAVCVRHATADTDTFVVRIDSARYWFDGELLTVSDGWVDHGMLFARSNQSSLPMTWTKWYDTATLIELTETPSP